MAAATSAPRREFGDCQLHVEWAAPSKVEGNSQGRGNSGIFVAGGATEVQVLDNYDNPTYPDGFAGSVYGVMPPAANPLNPPGEWQTYDIIFRRPIVKDGELIDPGSQTVIINGVVVQADHPARGRRRPQAPLERAPRLPREGADENPRPRQPGAVPQHLVPPRSGRARSTGAPTASSRRKRPRRKRAEIAASIREDAATKAGKDKLLRLMESLYYEVDAGAQAEAESLGEAWYESVVVSPDGKKGEVMQINNALKYLVKAKVLSPDHEGIIAVGELIKEQGWDK